MKFTCNWLKQYVDCDLAPAELADRLTMLGLEVDSVEELFADLAGVKVAKVVSVKRHPNADKLSLCEVEAGDTTSRVVCGAPNVKKGMLTAIALPGAVLPSGLKIKSSKIRGEVSEGMLCSEKDLGISDENVGIMSLPATAESGASLADTLELRDTLIEVDLTPNRPDCASVLGIAREAGGVVGRKITQPVKGKLPKLTGKKLPFSVEVRDKAACPRYCARLLTNVTIGPSPWWLRKRLLAVGQRPINNVVDVTNFVMLEYGQPLHAFDFKRLSGGKIVVRKAAAGETMVTLDGAEQTLDPEMLVICDAKKPVALAGVMGGENSEVTEQTTEILLESAYFDPIGIRRTARETKLATDSSYRFERGVDPEGVPRALERAVQLIKEVAGAKPAPGGVDACGAIAGPAPITLRVGRTADLLGMEFTAETIGAALSSIDIGVETVDADTLKVQPPAFRVDLEREIDLVEEVARLTGYNTIPATLPTVPTSFPEKDAGRDLRKKLAATMVSLGFYEAINYSFVTEKHSDMLGLAPDHPARTAVHLLNPLAEDQSIMRTMLLPGLLENLRHNVNHQEGDVRLFEIGKTFHPGGKTQPDEKHVLAAVVSGRRRPGAPVLHYGEAKADIYDVKGTAELILREMRLPQVTLEPDAAAVPYVEPGALVSLAANGSQVGRLGKLGRKCLKAFGIKQDVFFLHLDLDALGRLEAAPKIFKPLPKFPSVKWDIAFLLSDEVGGGDILKAIAEHGEPLEEGIEIFDVYRGKNIEPGMKSVGVTITYRAADRTLDDETVGRAHQKIIDLIVSRFNAQLREA